MLPLLSCPCSPICGSAVSSLKLERCTFGARHKQSPCDNAVQVYGDACITTHKVARHTHGRCSFLSRACNCNLAPQHVACGSLVQVRKYTQMRKPNKRATLQTDAAWDGAETGTNQGCCPTEHKLLVY